MKNLIVKILKLPKRIIGKWFNVYIYNKNWVILYYDDPSRSKIIDLIKKIIAETDLLLGINEAYQIFMAVKSTAKIKGDIAEVGVYKGGSAKIICEAKGEKNLHLFDTFSGLPEISEYDDKYFFKGQFVSSYQEVKDYLSAYKNVTLYKGFFPETASVLPEAIFSFINLDVDIYQSTLDSLVFFYPKMQVGGIIISHDYINSVGVKKAFTEFFADKPEPIIELSGSQCLIVKI